MSSQRNTRSTSIASDILPDAAPEINIPQLQDQDDFMEAIHKVSENFNVIFEFINSTKESVTKRNGALLAISTIYQNLNQITFLYANRSNNSSSSDAIQAIVRETLSQADSPISYSQIVKGPKSASVSQNIKKKYKAIIYPKKGNKNIETSDDTKRELTKKLNPFELKVSPSKIIKVKNNGVLIESENTLSHLIGHQKLEEIGLIAELPNKIWPRVSISNVPKDFTEVEICDAVISQTQSPPEFKECIKKAFKIGNPKSPTTTWVIELEPKLKNALMAKERLYINWNSCKVYNYVRLTRCYNCQRYGHTAKHCRSPKQCGFCASTDHESNACQSKQTPDRFNCANCLRSENHKKSATHNAADNNCPIYKSRLKDYLSNIET